MATPTLCYECGEYLGSVFEFINAAKQGYYKELTDNTYIDVDKIEISGNVAKSIDFILDAAQINKICCRKMFISYVDFTQYLK